MAKAEKKLKLGRLESQIMNIVWERGTASVHEVRDTLSTGKGPAYSTILTMMRNLENKGYLTHDVVDRKYVYRAVINQQRFRHSAVGELLSRLFNGSPALLVNSLLEQSSVSKEEMAEIKALIKREEERKS